MENNVRYFRKRYDISVEEIAQLINKSSRAVTGKENGKINWNKEEKNKITNFFKAIDRRVNKKMIFETDFVDELAT